MAWFEKGDDELHASVMSVMEKFHVAMYDAGVAITVLVAKSGERDKAALKFRGREAYGTIRITNLRDRALMLGDAIMTLNGDLLESWDDRRLRAVIDHELQHLELCVEKKSGKVMEDDLSRPKLKIRQHDYEFGWFSIVAERWGGDSYEVEQAKMLVGHTHWIQPLLPGFVPSAADVAEVMVKRKTKRAAAAAMA
jgi:hypothetical protein